MAKCDDWQIGVCSWSLQADVAAVAEVMRTLGLTHVHLAVRPALGADGDPTGESAAVVEFVDDVSKRPKARITRHPRRREPADGNRTKVRFAFKANTTAVESAFECRIERRRWRRCSSPKKYRVTSGRHRFRVRAEHAAGAGPRDTYRFRILRSAANG